MTDALSHIPLLETERLVLRAPRLSDFDAMLAFNDSPRSRILGGPQPRQTVWRGLLSNIGHWAVRGFGLYSVDTKAGEFIGRIGMIDHDGWPEPELAWHVYDSAEGKGFAYEAALAARDDAYARLNMAPMISMIDPANARSIALAKRLGAMLEQTGEHFGDPCHFYRHTKPEAANG